MIRLAGECWSWIQFNTFHLNFVKFQWFFRELNSRTRMHASSIMCWNVGCFEICLVCTKTFRWFFYEQIKSTSVYVEQMQMLMSTKVIWPVNHHFHISHFYLCISNCSKRVFPFEGGNIRLDIPLNVIGHLSPLKWNAVQLIIKMDKIAGCFGCPSWFTFYTLVVIVFLSVCPTVFNQNSFANVNSIQCTLNSNVFLVLFKTGHSSCLFDTFVTVILPLKIQ